jgi:hypothetical protein
LIGEASGAAGRKIAREMTTIINEIDERNAGCDM